MTTYWENVRWYDNNNVVHSCDRGSIVVTVYEGPYLTRIERKLGRKLTHEEAERLIEQYSAEGPSTSRFIDRMTIPF